MRLRTRIQLSTTTVLIIALIVTNMSIYFMFKDMAIKSEQNRLATKLYNIVKELNLNDKATMDQVLQAYLISDGLIRILDRSSSSSIQVYTDIDYRSIRSEYKDDQFAGVLTYRNSKFVIVSIPVINETGEVVNLQVIENANFLFANVHDLKWVLVFTTIIVIVILSATSGLLGRVVSLPIQRLTRTMKRIEENGSFEQIAITNHSKDELYEMAMTFNRMIAKLEDSYIKQEQFVSDASHELKTPLTVIDSYVKLLKRWGKERPDILEEAIDSISSESSRMKYLTEQLLQLTKSEEVIENEKEIVNLVPVIEATIQRMQQACRHAIYFKTESYEIRMKLHEQSFIQLLVILLDNAKKYSDDDIHVELREGAESVSLSVSDKGVGIPIENQVHVFDRLYRVDKTRSRKTGGSGLGLSIAKRIALQHGGDITLKSAEGKGSTFTVIWPK